MRMKLPVLIVALGLAAPAAHAQAGSITDAQIASIVVTANQVDIDAGRAAAAKTTNAEVNKFAQLKEGGAANVTALSALSGAAFDKAYVDHEVAYHQQVLDAVDKTLIPNAKNAELKALLVKVRPAFVAHLEHARHLQSTLGGKH
jgi:putative membrane protein